MKQREELTICEQYVGDNCEGCPNAEICPHFPNIEEWSDIERWSLKHAKEIYDGING